MKETKFTKKDFSFVCPMQWDDMQESENGRFCAKCQQEVVDVTDCSLEEVHQMQRKDPQLCVAIKTLLTAGVALTMAGCSPSPPVYGRTAGAPAPPPHHVDDTKKQDQHRADVLKKSEEKARCALPDNKVKKK